MQVGILNQIKNPEQITLQVLKVLSAARHQKDKLATIRWNNAMIGKRLCDLPDGVQEHFVEYIPKFCKPPSKVKFFFDVYDVEEGVL